MRHLSEAMLLFLALSSLLVTTLRDLLLLSTFHCSPKSCFKWIANEWIKSLTTDFLLPTLWHCVPKSMLFQPLQLVIHSKDMCQNDAWGHCKSGIQTHVLASKWPLEHENLKITETSKPKTVLDAKTFAEDLRPF